MLRAVSWLGQESGGGYRPKPMGSDDDDRDDAPEAEGQPREGGGPVRRRADPAPRGRGHYIQSEPRVRRGTYRLPIEAVHRIRAGHPWVYRDTLGDRPLRGTPGEIVDLSTQEGTFVARGILDPEGPIAVRVIGRDPGELFDSEAILRRVRAAADLRSTLLPVRRSDKDTAPAEPLTGYRVLHTEGDFVPGITVDRYGDFLVVHVFSPSLEIHLPAVADALMAVHKPAGIYVQRRFRPLGGDGPREPAELFRGAVAPVEIVVEESGLRFAVDVTAPLGTGLFLDLRRGREAVQARARGRRVLNLFSYTGAFSVHAAKGGATEVVSVDLSPKAHARARHNLELSGLPETGHEFITGDVMAVLSRMADRKRRFDAIVLDPPAFSHVKDKDRDRERDSRERTFSVQRDYRDVVRAALSVMAPGGLLFCAANAARFTVEELGSAIGDGASMAGRYIRTIESAGLPPDFPVPPGFPEGNYLKFLTCAVV